MPVSGQDLVAKNIIKFGGGFTANVNRVMNKVKAVLDQRVTINMSLSDHSLADLRRLGHPYASRWGSGGKGLHSPIYQVHMQSGKLFKSKEAGVIEATINSGTLKAKAYVGLNKEVAPYAPQVIFGTSKMIPRSFLQGSKLEVTEQVRDMIKNDLKNLRVS